VEISNDTQADISSLEFRSGGISMDWASLPAGEAVSRSTGLPVLDRLVVTYTAGTTTVSDTLEIPDGCDSSSVVSVWIGGDATSVKYTD
jgi:hypothetical protein